MRRIALVTTICAAALASLWNPVAAQDPNKPRYAFQETPTHYPSESAEIKPENPVSQTETPDLRSGECISEDWIDDASPNICPSARCAAIWEQVISSVARDSQDRMQGISQMQKSLSADQAIAECLKLTSAYPWEDEDDPASGGPDQAHNCRDFSYGFLACMAQYGFATGHVAALSMSCRGCDDEDRNRKGHRINLARTSDGIICPFEPKWSKEKNAAIYGQCCNSNQTLAAECANRVYCTEEGATPKTQEYLCCKPDKYKILSAATCSGDSASCYQDKEGKYICPPNPHRCRPRKKELTECDRKIRQCLAISDPKLPSTTLCENCGRKALCLSTWFWDNL